MESLQSKTKETVSAMGPRERPSSAEGRDREVDWQINKKIVQYEIHSLTEHASQSTIQSEQIHSIVDIKKAIAQNRVKQKKALEVYFYRKAIQELKVQNERNLKKQKKSPTSNEATGKKQQIASDEGCDGKHDEEEEELDHCDSVYGSVTDSHDLSAEEGSQHSSKRDDDDIKLEAGMDPFRYVDQIIDEYLDMNAVSDLLQQKDFLYNKKEHLKQEFPPKPFESVLRARKNRFTDISSENGLDHRN